MTFKDLKNFLLKKGFNSVKNATEENVININSSEYSYINNKKTTNIILFSYQRTNNISFSNDGKKINKKCYTIFMLIPDEKMEIKDISHIMKLKTPLWTDYNLNTYAHFEQFDLEKLNETDLDYLFTKQETTYKFLNELHNDEKICKLNAIIYEKRQEINNLQKQINSIYKKITNYCNRMLAID